LDTGADISLIKNKYIDSNLININDKYVLSGITSEKTYTKGSIEQEVFTRCHAINHVFHVVEDDFPIPTPALLGKDFFGKFKTKLDFEEMTLSIAEEEISFSIDMLSGPDEEVICIPPRCEVIKRWENIDFSRSEDLFIDNQELAPGVLIARYLVNKANPFIKILNTNEELLTIKKSIIKTEPLENFDIFYSNENNGSRKETVEKIMSENSHCEPEIHKELRKLINNNIDVFAGKDTPLTCNNFYKQKNIP
jgi:hypothetical protein